jgi:serine/threonine protein kinase
MPSSRCSSPQELAAFLAGQLSPETEQAIATHVEACPDCERSLQTACDANDSLAVRLRQAQPTTASLDPEVQAHLDRAKALIPDTLPDAPPIVPPGYKLLERIGRGALGEVWRAEAPGGIQVALKMIFGSLDAKEAQQELKALEVMKRLAHPFLMHLQAYWPMPDRLLIASELAEGSLRARLNACRQVGQDSIPRAELLGYMREAAEALDYLHGENVLHRDIKPDNILILKRHAKVADFGLARLVASHRQTGSTAGTPLFMAPEAWNAQAVPQSDQYSLAITYVELRLGKPPFPGGEFYEVMMCHYEKEPDLSALEESEQKVLHRALAKKPEQRFTTCTEFVNALAQTGTLPPIPIAPSRLWIPALVVLLLLVAGAVAWPFLHRPHEQSGSPQLAPVVEKARPYQSLRDVLAHIRTHLEHTSADERKYQRYFTLTNLYNNPRVTGDELRLCREALSKVTYLSSSRGTSVQLQVADDTETLFAIELSSTWRKADVWNKFLRTYPYGLKYNGHSDSAVRELAVSVEKLSGADELLCLRADWFIVTQSVEYQELRDSPELINPVTRLYFHELGPADAAAELGIEKAETLQKLIREKKELQELGLGPLADGDTIKRTTWAALDPPIISLFQKAARDLGLGTPHRER